MKVGSKWEKTGEEEMSVKILACPQIRPNLTSLYVGDSFSYNVTNVPENGVSYNWECRENCIIIGGQGTSNPTFRAINSGQAKVKATITREGRSIAIEDSGAEILALPITANTTLICNGETVEYSIGHVPSDATIVWEPISSYMQLVSGQGTANATFRYNEPQPSSSLTPRDGFSRIKATVSFNGNNYIAENSNVWKGIPYSPSIENYHNPRDYRFLVNNEYTFYSVPYTYPVLVTWIVGGRADLISGSLTTTENGITIKTQNIPKGTIDYFLVGPINTENRCGRSANSYAGLFTLDNSGDLEGNDDDLDPEKPTPIPVPILKSMSNTETNLSDRLDIKVYSFTTGQMVYQKKDMINFNINNTTLKNGIYIIQATNKEGKITREKVVKGK